MKSKRPFIAIFAVITIATLLVTGCSTPTATPTTTTQSTPTTTVVAPAPVTTVVEKDKTYNALSPRGIALPVTIKALAPRPSSLDGLTVYICQGEADPIIMPALAKVAPVKAPKTTWVYFNPVSGFGPASPEDEVLAKAKAVVRGISW